MEVLKRTFNLLKMQKKKSTACLKWRAILSNLQCSSLILSLFHLINESNVFSSLLLVINTSPCFFVFDGRLLGRDSTVNCFWYQVLHRLCQPTYFVKNTSQFAAVYSLDCAFSVSVKEKGSLGEALSKLTSITTVDSAKLKRTAFLLLPSPCLHGRCVGQQEQHSETKS